MKNPFKRKVNIPLTHGEQLQNAKAKGDYALSIFNIAHEQLDEANSELSVLVADALVKVAELTQHINDANDEILANRSVQGKLTDFISQ